MLDMIAPRARARRVRHPIAFRDDRGIPCLRVPLDDEGRMVALVERDDYDRLLAAGFTSTWTRSGNGSRTRPRFYVAAHAPEVGPARPSPVLVARVIVGAGHRQRVRFVNGDTLDLRRPNLRLEGGGAGAAKHDAREVVAQAVSRREAKRRGQPLDVPCAA